MRAVFDTNVLVSAHLSLTGLPARLLERWRQRHFEIIISIPLLDEVQTTMRREHLRRMHRLDDVAIWEMADELKTEGRLVEVQRTLGVVLADPDDNKIIECAVAGNADVIVTGDKKHLLPLGSYEGIPIVSPAALLTMLDDTLRAG
ncbi:MAG: putative toxin-antitoxin system toxin component, PIN family [Thermomicrobiales bacterium]